MENSTKYVLVNLDGECMPKMIYAKQGDVGTRMLNFAFVQNQTSTERIVLEENTQAKARFKLPNKTAYEVECEIGTNRDSASVIIPQEALTSPGVLLVDVCLYQGENILSTSTFEIRVLESSLAEASGSVVIGGKFLNVKSLTRAQYNAIESPSNDTIYLVDDSYYSDETVITVYVGNKQIGSQGVNDSGETSVFLKRAVAQYEASYARLYSDENYNVTLAREIYTRGGSRTIGLILEERLNEDTGLSEGVAHLYAPDRILLTVGHAPYSVLEVTEDGVTFNGKSLGGGVNIGGTIGIMPNALSTSIIGELEEV